MKIHMAMMCQNELSDVVANITAALPYIDTCTIIDGGSADNTLLVLRNWAQREPKIRPFLRQWRDNFPDQRNFYVQKIREIAKDGDWILAVDPDEFMSEPALGSLRRLAEFVPTKKEKYQAVSFQCRSVTTSAGIKINESTDYYWKCLYFKLSPKLHYGHHGETPVHEVLHGVHPIYQTGHHPEFPSLMYEHRKENFQIWKNGARNAFISGSGDNLGSKNKSWVELRKITSRLGLNTWKDFHAALIAGCLDKELHHWIINHRHESGYTGSSEIREFYKYFFKILHPEEEPAELRNEHIA